MTWHASGDQLMIQPAIAADRTKSGIYLPDEHRELPQLGLVLDAGTGTPLLHQPGDLVAFGKYAGVRFRLDDGQEVILLRDNEILAHKPSGTFRLVTHTIDHGTARRDVFHQEGETCEHCPVPTRVPSKVLAAERARLLRESKGKGDGTGEP
jgi:chaperonin GroES